MAFQTRHFWFTFPRRSPSSGSTHTTRGTALGKSFTPDLLALQTSPGEVSATLTASPVERPPCGSGLIDTQCLEAMMTTLAGWRLWL